ncbi:biotin synthase BioB [Salidesulfovibrio onnuriiensis]|uniref:biotin synthase BioB n=1 Tax=Salidesulfovibrio onnuriiensis TaxID=2583823 RepID=UPI0011CA56A2|nr:biotin synthase BioB [Salidesulfovibrio onnuriiensis]
MIFLSIAEKAMNGQAPDDAEIRAIIDADEESLPALLEQAHRIRTRFSGQTVSLCAIVNARSGRCSEDCSFCAQSSHHSTRAPEYPLLAPDEIGRAARRAAQNGARRFGIVASGKFVGGSDFQGYLEAVRLVAEAGLLPDLSPGILTRGQILALKEAGLFGYHHNLETSASHFPQVCTTHSYEEDVQAVRTALECGLYVCSGGIFGIGESWDDRVELALMLRELGVPSVPVNFLTPIPGTPLEHREVLRPAEALKIVALFRFLLPDRAIRICGGRLAVFGEGRKAELLRAGADGLMVGDYLTTKGGEIRSDLGDIERAGLVIERQ